MNHLRTTTTQIKSNFIYDIIFQTKAFQIFMANSLTYFKHLPENFEAFPSGNFQKKNVKCV